MMMKLKINQMRKTAVQKNPVAVSHEVSLKTTSALVQVLTVS